MKNRKGFTLIEILLVVAIIAVLSVVVFVALNPSKRLQDSKDARRHADVDTILTAVHQSIVDNKGTLPTNLPAAGTTAQLGTSASGCGITNSVCNFATAGCVDLLTGSQNLAAYLKTMPIDPAGGSYDNTKTGYAVTRDANNIVTITACGSDTTATISASR